ncbi:MAG: FMN-binding negative transcriptional regulator [Hyphomicrobiaceae bacterium]
MYVHPKFAISADEALAFARKRGFGVAVACNRGKPIAVHVPFVIRSDEQRRVAVEFHVSKANPIAACADACMDWLIVVQGPDAYVSADWYVSQDQVPTWLYEAVHLTGPVRAMPVGQTHRHSDELSAEFERRLLPKPPWTSEKMSEARREGLRSGIVGLTMQVLTIEGQRKLNQHKADPDFIAVADHLLEVGEHSSGLIGAEMQKERPHLPYKTARTPQTEPAE